MARGAAWRRSTTPTAPRANSLVASAVDLGRVTGAGHPGRPGGTQEWQNEAWYFLDTVGELAFAAGWFANAMSRVRLFPQREGPDGPVELTSGPAFEAMAQLGDQSQMMGSFGIHLFIPGECYLVGYEDDLGREDWSVYSVDEVKQQGSSTRWEIARGDGEKAIIDTAPDAEQPAVVIRIWRSHPRLWVEATSPVRAVLPVLRELEGLTKHVGATIDSRLAGAGVLAIPSEMTFSSPAPAAPPGTEGVAPVEDAAAVDKFLADLADAMLTPIKDRGNAAAVVPIVIRAPGALLGNIRHITMSTPFDEKTLELRTEDIRRLALGLDMPPEVLLGTGDVNHWGAWQIDEAGLKVHIEPGAELVADAVAEKYLIPVLAGQGQDTTDIGVGIDTSALRNRPNRTAEAFELYDRLGIDLDALLRETGFESGDKPDPAEVSAMILTKVALGAVTPELAAAAMAALGTPLTPAPATTEESAPADAPAIEPPPAPETDPQNRTDPPAQEAAALLAAAEPLVARAVERTRNRVHGRGKTARPMPPDDAMAALAHEFDAALVMRTANRLGLSPAGFGRGLAQAAAVVLVTGVDSIDDEDLRRCLALHVHVPESARG